MTSLPDRIDGGLLDCAQRISDFIDGALAFNHWAVARALLRCGLACFIASPLVALRIEGAGALPVALDLFLCCFWFFIYTGLMTNLREQQASPSLGRALRVIESRIRRLDLLVTAAVSVVLSIGLELSGFIFILGVFAMHLHYYFKAADLPPPSTSTKPAFRP
ncbi:hypothetical protein [Sphingomonas sp. 3-13AW]|uniref:hypothetical protein n=1 Tax=Sphingomonas sp. 3-13AW TaxID=3050450 RepID=UPI003BB63FF8